MKKELKIILNGRKENGLKKTAQLVFGFFNNFINNEDNIITPNDKIIKGVLLEKTLCGPELTQIDLTNDCNNSCLGCWIHSAFIKKSHHEKKQFIPTKKVIKTLKDLKGLGTKKIILSGGGEPLKHPDIIKTIQTIKKLGFELTLISNFNLLNKKIIDKLVRNLPKKKNEILISVWAATSDTYVKNHPNQTKKSFELLTKNIQYFVKKKKKNTKVRVINVINSQNYEEIEEMIKFSLILGVEEVEFILTDIVKGKTDFLKISKKEQEYLLKKFIDLKEKMIKNIKEEIYYSIDDILFWKYFQKLKMYMKKEYQTIIPETLSEANQREFMKKEVKKHLKNEKIERINDLRFAIGTFKDYCLTYGTREKKVDVFAIDKIISLLKKDITTQYKKEIDLIPCYAGYTYTRILANGKVIPCCKAVNNPIDNINQRSFKDIWFSKKYEEFRIKAKNLKKNNAYFKKINCYKGCDNYAENKRWNKLIKKEIVQK